MQLVPRDVHTRTGHTGSIGINNLPGRKMERKSMLPTMLSKHKAVSHKELQHFESEIGYPLPPAYFAFLLSANGGRPKQDTFQITGFHNNPYGSIHFFFGLNVDTWSYNLGEMYRWFAAAVPTGILTIGCTAGADYICLDQRASDDRVIYWDQRHHWGTGEWREQDVYPIAATFSDFLVSLRPNPYA